MNPVLPGQPRQARAAVANWARSRAGAALVAAALGAALPVAAQSQSPEPQGADGAKKWLSLGVGSQHLSRAEEFNQKNPGLGLEWPLKTTAWPDIDTRLAIGFFKNSENARSTYAGGFVFPWQSQSGSVKWGALVGVINGYQRANSGGYFPLLVPTVAYEGDRFGANVFLVPPVAGIPATFALQLKISF